MPFCPSGRRRQRERRPGDLGTPISLATSFNLVCLFAPGSRRGHSCRRPLHRPALCEHSRGSFSPAAEFRIEAAVPLTAVDPLTAPENPTMPGVSSPLIDPTEPDGPPPPLRQVLLGYGALVVVS